MDDGAQIFQDGYRNFIANVGTERDKASGGHFYVPVLTNDQLIAAYRSSWVARKVVDIIADDATRQWRNWNADKDDISRIENEEKRLRLKEVLRSAMKSARLFGAAAIHFAIDGDDNLEEPLDPASVPLGGIKHLTLIPKIAFNPQPLNTDPLSEYFGKAEFYELTGGNRLQETNLQRTKIHASRLIVLNGQTIPEGGYTNSQLGISDSVLQSVYDAILKADGTASNIASLVFESKVDVINIPGLNSGIAARPGFEDALLARFSLAARAKSNNGVLILDGEETYSTKNNTYAQLPEVMDRFFQNVSGASDIPMTRLYGMSPAGLNATGESDLKNYYDRVKSLQELDVDPQMSVFNEALKFSAFGADRPDVFHEWRPLWQMSDKERVEIGKTVTDIAKALSDGGIITPDAISEATANALIEYNVLPGLEAAIDEYGAIPPEPTEAELAAMMGTGAPQGGPQGQGGGRKPDLRLVGDMTPLPLYVRRDLVNVKEFTTWANSQGLAVNDDLHVTILYSKTPVDWMKMGEPFWGNMEVAEGGPRVISIFGDCIVLEFACSELRWRHENMIENGASSDFPNYAAHVTICANDGRDISKVEPYRGKLKFGPEIFEPIKEKELADSATASFTGDGFDPSQPRDYRGRWVKAGGASYYAGEPSTMSVEQMRAEQDAYIDLLSERYNSQFNEHIQNLENEIKLRQIAQLNSMSESELRERLTQLNNPDHSLSEEERAERLLIAREVLPSVIRRSLTERQERINAELNGIENMTRAEVEALRNEQREISQNSTENSEEQIYANQKERALNTELNIRNRVEGIGNESIEGLRSLINAEGTDRRLVEAAKPILETKLAQGNDLRSKIESNFDKNTKSEILSKFNSMNNEWPQDEDSEIIDHLQSVGANPQDLITPFMSKSFYDTPEKLEQTRHSINQNSNGDIQIAISSQLGKIERTFSVEGGEIVVSHDLFSLRSEAQGNGISKEIMRNSMTAYQEMGVSRIDVHANIDAGGYVWARYGFTPSKESWSEIRSHARTMFDGRDDDGTFWAAIESDNPKAIWALADSPRGKELLRGSDWYGSLDLSDKEAVERFNRQAKRN